MLTVRPVAPPSHSPIAPVVGEVTDPTPLKGLACPSCGSRRLRVTYTRAGAGGTVRRSRRCQECGARFRTGEALLADPT